MPDIETLYHVLFNAATDAVEAIERFDYGRARQILVEAQLKTEEACIEE